MSNIGRVFGIILIVFLRKIRNLHIYVIFLFTKVTRLINFPQMKLKFVIQTARTFVAFISA